MAHLSKLRFSDKQRSQVKMTVEERLRHKLIDRLKEQKELAEADLNGKALVRTRHKMIKDEETGETRRVEVPRLMRRWWWNRCGSAGTSLRQQADRHRRQQEHDRSRGYG